MGKESLDQEWENRVLCSDESCIGVIGPDGRCKECGLAYEGDLPSGWPANHDKIDAAGTADDDVAADQEQGQEQGVDTARISDEEWENRKLCRDESCIGVIGPDGRCKECGLAYDEE